MYVIGPGSSCVIQYFLYAFHVSLLIFIKKNKMKIMLHFNKWSLANPIFLSFSMFYASPGAWGGDTGFPPSSGCSYYKSYPHGKSLPFGFWAVCLNVSFWHAFNTFPRGVNPKATLGKFHPKAILGSELREGGSCALPLLASCLDAMLYFFVHSISVQ